MFSKKSEIRVIFTKVTSNAPSELRTFFQSCLLEDFHEISKVRDQFKSDFQMLLAITSKSDADGRDKWKTCCVLRQDKKFQIRSSSYKSEQVKSVTFAFGDFRDVLEQFHKAYDDDGCYSIIDAIKALEIFSRETLDEMGKVLIEIGLNENFLTKYSARKFVEILKNFLESGNQLKVNESQLKNLIHILNSENFAYDEGKVQLETLKVLKTFKCKNFAEFSFESLENIQKFLERNRFSYKDSIIKCEKTIKAKPNSENYRAMLGYFMQHRIDFLTSIAIFGGKVHEKDLQESLTLKNSQNILKEKEGKLRKVSDEIDKVKADSNSKPSALIRVSCEFNELEKEINYLKVIESAKSELKIGEFLKEFSKAYSKKKADKGVIEKIKEFIEDITDAPKAETSYFESFFAYADSKVLTHAEARSFMLIIANSDCESFDDIPLNVLKALDDKDEDESHDDGFDLTKAIVDVGLQKTLKKPQHYIDYISNLLVSNKYDNEALKVLKKYESFLCDYEKSVVELMDDIEETKKIEAYAKIETMIKGNQKVPAKVFKFLENFLKDEKTFKVINKILEAGLQKLPKDLINLIAEKLDQLDSNVKAHKVKTIHLLLLKGLVKIHQIENFCIEALKIEPDATLNIIYNAIQLDQKISEKLLSGVKSQKYKKHNRNLVSFIINAESKLTKLTSGKTSREEKMKIFDEIEENVENFQYEKTSQTLIKLVLYDESVAKRAFKVLTHIIHEKSEMKNEKLCKIVLYALRCNSKFETVEEFLKKFEVDYESLLENCKNENMKNMLEDAFDIANFNELSNKKLKKILTKEQKLTEDDVIALLNALEDENYSKYFKSIAQVLKDVTLNKSAQIHIKFILKDNVFHQVFEELLSLLPRDDQKYFRKSLNEPTVFIENAINELRINFINIKALESLTESNLLENFNEDHLKALENIVGGICQSIDHKFEEVEEIDEHLCFSLLTILKLLTNFNFDDENFPNQLLKRILGWLKVENVYEKIEENSSECLRLSVALLHLSHYETALNDEIFKSFDPNSWSSHLLIHVLLNFCEHPNDFDLLDFHQVMDGVNDEDKNFLLYAIIEKCESKNFSLKKIVDLIVILKSDESFLKKFKSTDDYDEIISVRLHESWLKSSLLKNCIVEDLKDFKILMIYRPLIIDELLNADKNKLNLDDFIRIFKALELCPATHDEKCGKLSTLSAFENTTWLPTIELFLIEELVKTIMKNVKDSNIRKFKRFQYLLQRIYHTGWSINSIQEILKKVKTSEDVTKVTRALRTIYEYQIDELHCNAMGKKALEIITRESDFAQIFESLHQIVIHNTFGGAKKKSLEALCDEISKNNPKLTHNLADDFAKIQEAYQNQSKVIKVNSVIKEWKESDIEEWSKRARDYRHIASRNVNNDTMTICMYVASEQGESNSGLERDEHDEVKNPSIYETIAVLMRATKLFKGYEPREVQVLSVLVLLNPDGDKGRLTQINTGEGKTTIVAMLSVIKALAGHTIDVITSSPELAKPQVKELKGFYKMFGLSVDHTEGDAGRYKCDIVYGAASNFQGDILRDEYSKLGTRSGRQCDFAIVDEVDSMLIDGRKHIVMLSSSMPGMNYLEHFYAIIWSQIKIFANAVVEQDGKTYFVHREADEAGNMNDDADANWLPLEQSKESFIKEKTLEFLKKELEKGDNSQFKIPNHLRELILSYQLDQWIGCAIFARYNSKNNQNYILDKSKVVPVDSDNTGVLQESMNWSNGLHQFLQIKHGAKITPESLTTNYISNVAFFKRYGNNLFGLTGTLGSESAKQLLERTYNVDSVIIPPFMVKRFKELSAIIENDKQDWYHSIVESNMNHLHNQRAVLIITRFISEAQKLHKRFTAKFEELKWKTSKIRQYKTDHESQAVKEAVESGDLIIATNIAGRGTDIKTSKNVEANGGLHVCVISLPSNERVEQQNVGRTSRTGKLGTSQFIIYHKHHSDINFLKVYRDELENQDLESAEQEMNKTLIKDKVFEKFCGLLQIVPNNMAKKAVEDRFGIWLQMHSEVNDKLCEAFSHFESDIRDNISRNVINRIQALEIFEDADEKVKRQEVKNDLEQAKIIKNPVFHILLGNKCVKQKMYAEAIREYDKAIELEREFAEIAYYNRGYARLIQNCNDTKNKNSEVRQCIEDFKMAREKITNREAELQVIQTAKEDTAKVLSEQVEHKLILYGMQKNAIEQAIGIDMQEHEEVLKDLEGQLTKLNAEKEKLPLRKEKFAAMENLDAKLDSLNEKKQKIKQDKGDYKKVLTEIRALLDSQEYQDYESLKEKIEFGEKIPENINLVQKQIDAQKKRKEDNTEGIILKCLNKGNDMKVEIKGIPESIPSDQDVKLYTEEIDEFKANGMLGAFHVTEVPPMDWGAFFGVLALGIVQIVAGAALCVFCCGAGYSLGSSMLMEGLSDVVTAVKDGLINRSFSWVQYGIQKAISYGVAILCMGMGALKDAAKTLFAGLKGVGTAVTQVAKRGWILMAKKIGVEIGKKVGNEIALELINIGVNRALIPQINKAITEQITPKITKCMERNEIVQKWLQLDEKNRDTAYQSIIMGIASDIIYYEQEKGALRQIAEGIADGVASQKIKGYDAIKKMMDIKELIEFTDTFLGKFESEIKKRNEENMKEEEKERQREKRKQELAAYREDDEELNEEQQLKEHGASHDEIIIRPSDNITQLISHQRSSTFFDEKEQQDEADQKSEQPEEQVDHSNRGTDPKTAYVKLSEMVSNQITQKINGNFIAPFSSSIVKKGIDKLSSKLDAKLEKQLQLFKSERRIEFLQSKKKSKRLDKQQKQAHNDPIIMAEVDNDIAKFGEGERVGVQHLGAVSDALGVQIKVLDEKGKLVRTVGEGTPVEVRYNGNGHYTLKDGSEPTVKSGNKNDCIFDVIAHQTGQSENVKDMRAKTVEALKANKNSLAHQYADVQFLRAHKPEALHEGGQFVGHRDEVKQYTESLKDKSILQDVEGHAELTKRAKDKDLERMFKIEFDHVPPFNVIQQALFATPAFQKLSEHEQKQQLDDYYNKFILTHAVDYKDHRQYLTTGSSRVTREYHNASTQDILKDSKIGFTKNVQRSLIDTFKTSFEMGRATYDQESLKQFATKYREIGLLNDTGANKIISMLDKMPKYNFTSADLENLGIYKFQPNNKADQILKMRLDGTLKAYEHRLEQQAKDKQKLTRKRKREE